MTSEEANLWNNMIAELREINRNLETLKKFLKEIRDERR